MAGCTNSLKDTKVIFLVWLFFLLQTQTAEGIEIIELKDGQEVTSREPQHFCYLNNVKPGWRETWTRIQVRVWSSRELKVTVVNDEQALQDLEHFSIWTLVQYFIREQTNETFVDINLFAPKTCFRVDPSNSQTTYMVKPSRKLDFFLFGVFLTGVLLYFCADNLSRSQVFYYSAGMSTGMVASLLILIYIMARFLPKKSPFYMLIVGGWSFSVYVIQLVCRNLKVILKEHWPLAIGYTAVVGFISFAVCYCHGPLVDRRSINILSWTLQLFGLLLIYAGIQVQQVALAIMVAAFCAKNVDYPINLAISVCNQEKLKCFWVQKENYNNQGLIRFLIKDNDSKVNRRLCWKLEPRRLLTEEEYQKQAEVETSRALEELRKYCNSPEFNTWKNVAKLQSPKSQSQPARYLHTYSGSIASRSSNRFADFVEGSPHLMPGEVSVHAQEYGFEGSFLDDEMFSTDEEDEEEFEGEWKKDLRNSL